MIMPRGADQLLLPVNPLFIAASLLFALGFNLMPLGRQPAMPDLLALALVFWDVHQPLRVGVGIAFVFGLLMDVHQGALFGQHALAYTLLAYLASRPSPPVVVLGARSRRCRCCRCSSPRTVSLRCVWLPGTFPGLAAAVVRH